MSILMNTKTISVSIEAAPQAVYEFVFDMHNFPQWVTSFVESIRQSDGEWWTLTTSEGNMQIRFVAKNEFGVLDHYVRIASGQEFFNPMRVLANGAGSEVLFTLFQTADMSEERFLGDAAMVERDLQTLKQVMER